MLSDARGYITQRVTMPVPLAVPPPLQGHRLKLVQQFCHVIDAKSNKVVAARHPVEPLSHAGFEFLHKPFDTREVHFQGESVKLFRFQLGGALLFYLWCHTHMLLPLTGPRLHGQQAGEVDHIP